MLSLFKKKEEAPTIINGWHPDRFCTDYANLQTKMWWRLFVYNDWQDNQANHGMLGDEAVKCAAAFTHDRHFVVLKKRLGVDTFPFALEMGPESDFGYESFLGPRGQVLGQLYKVRPQTLKYLDNEVLQGVQFNRVRIKVDIPYRDYQGDDGAFSVSEPKNHTVEAWAYIGNRDYWLDGHGVNDYYTPPIRRFAVVKSLLNQNKESKVYYYYNDRFEISGQ